MKVRGKIWFPRTCDSSRYKTDCHITQLCLIVAGTNVYNQIGLLDIIPFDEVKLAIQLWLFDFIASKDI